MKQEMNNDVLINRAIMGWEWYKDVNTYKLFTHLIYKANYEDAPYRGVNVKRGQVYTGLNQLSIETGLSVQQTKTALKKLHSSNEITSKSTNKYRLITVCKYDTYQLTNKQNNKQPTSKTTNKDSVEITPYKEVLKELEELKEELKKLKQKKSTGFVKPTVEDINKYCLEKSYNIDAESFIAFYDSNGWKVGKNPMKSWKSALTTWHKRNNKNNNGRTPQEQEAYIQQLLESD